MQSAKSQAPFFVLIAHASLTPVILYRAVYWGL